MRSPPSEGVRLLFVWLVGCLVGAAAQDGVWSQIPLFQAANETTCRCFPGDDCWPSQETWQTFNQTLEGRLLKTVPIASVCHTDGDEPFDEDKCAQLRDVWHLASTHAGHPSSIMAPVFANASCDPFSEKDAQCVVGAYVQYVVNATGATDYQRAIEFAKTYNIRLVIRNTGHDYLGKSNGAGALSIWTHHLKDIQFIDYESTGYSGKAIKVGAGVEVMEAYRAAHERGLVVVGGNEPTVGLAGGYTQGGGHGPLVSRFGLAADQVLEWEVVTGTGQLLKASASENSDLYWALSGGGGGTYGVVLSMTAKVYPDEPTVAANLTIVATGESGQFWDSVSTFISGLPSLLDDGGKSDWFLLPGPATIFVTMPTIGFGMSKARLQEFFQPTLDKLAKYNLTHMYNIEEFPTFLDCHAQMINSYNVSNAVMGGRLIPRSTVTSNIDGLITSLQTLNGKGAVACGVSVNAAKRPETPSNAVLPAWRDAAFASVFGVPWDDTTWEGNFQAQDVVTKELGPELAKLDPDGGAYLSEGDANQPNWQKVFYGTNYDGLLAVKQKYDPDDVFYATTAVGSEYWEEKADKRLCKSTKLNFMDQIKAAAQNLW